MQSRAGLYAPETADWMLKCCQGIPTTPRHANAWLEETISDNRLSTPIAGL